VVHPADPGGRLHRRAVAAVTALWKRVVLKASHVCGRCDTAVGTVDRWSSTWDMDIEVVEPAFINAVTGETICADCHSDETRES
jgi:hypothetical protein